MVNAYNYSNTAAQTTLSGNISNAVLSFGVAATTGFPTTPFVLALDYGAAAEELVVVTGVAGTTLTVTRGFSGTSAQSHSIGAIVRHVVNAQDLTDFRTHEAATASVHGVTGALVGATSVQTLTNKTLSSPAITAPAVTGGGSLAGTFTGTPTFSGNVTHTGEIVIPNLIRGSRTLATDSQIESRVTGDATARWFVQADGKHWWGAGVGAVDTNLYRFAANSLKTDDDFTAVGTLLATPSSGSADGLSANLPSGTTGDLMNLRVNSAIQAAMDSSGQFRVYGGNAPTTYTPTVGGGGTVTWTTRTGYYWKIGKMVHVVIYLAINAAGSGAVNVTVDMPSTVDRTTRQMIPVQAEALTASYNGSDSLVFFTSGTGATADRFRTFDGTNITGAQLAAGGIIVAEGWYREA